MNKKVIFAFAKILALFFVLIIIFMFLFYIKFEKRNNDRVQNDLNPILINSEHYDDFKNNVKEVVNERKKYEIKNKKIYSSNELSLDEYRYVSEFSKGYIKEIRERYVSLVGSKENGYCEIVVNLRNKKYDFIDCNSNFIFQRGVEIAIEQFNDEYEKYETVENINKKINIYFSYNKK